MRDFIEEYDPHSNIGVFCSLTKMREMFFSILLDLDFLSIVDISYVKKDIHIKKKLRNLEKELFSSSFPYKKKKLYYSPLDKKKSKQIYFAKILSKSKISVLVVIEHRRIH